MAGGKSEDVQRGGQLVGGSNCLPIAAFRNFSMMESYYGGLNENARPIRSYI